MYYRYPLFPNHAVTSVKLEFFLQFFSWKGIIIQSFLLELIMIDKYDTKTPFNGQVAVTSITLCFGGEASWR